MAIARPSGVSGLRRLATALRAAVVGAIAPWLRPRGRLGAAAEKALLEVLVLVRLLGPLGR
eukprot:12460392-Alexandrium_andersonii.AAC.1